MRMRVLVLGLIVALVVASPAWRPAPAYAAGETVLTDGGAWQIAAQLIKRLWLEAYLLIDRLMDGSRSGDGSGGCCCCGQQGCNGGCGGGSGGSGGTGGSGGGGTPPTNNP